MSHLKSFTAALFACSVLVAGCSRDPSTAEEKTAKGDELLKRMSNTLAAAKAFTYTTDETRERMQDGKKVVRRTAHRVTIRRPDRAHSRITGEGVDREFWYDGKTITFASHKDNVWARGPVPGTLDEMFDFIYTEYGVPVAMADLLYSVPYDAFVVGGSKGGWVGRETINGKSCDHLAYDNPHSNWEIWLEDDERARPCQLKITHKEEPGAPVTQIVFLDAKLEPAGDDTFAPKIDESKYQRIYLLRASTAEPEPDPAGPAPAKPVEQATQPRK
jgi:hypothetical protein